MKYVLCASVSAVALIALPCPAFAQTGGETASEENQQSSDRDDVIVVTATRREMNVQDIPLSVTAFSQEELTTKGDRRL